MTEHVDRFLTGLSPRHQAALRWFAERAGTEQPWPAPIETSEGPTFLASKAKGIYKPEWTSYALSVKQTLGGPYPDLDPIEIEGGSWLYRYFQENEDPAARDSEFTNRGLMACMRNRVPVGVMRQTSPKPNTRYKILGLAFVAQWDAGYFFLEGITPTTPPPTPGPEAEINMLARMYEQRRLVQAPFDPKNTIDARERTVAQIVQRRGQAAFRRELLIAYEGKCAISGCDAEQALEAAHIRPYRGKDTDRVENGLLLRADLHTLFDVGLIAIEPASLSILLAPKLTTSSYANMVGRSLRVPQQEALRPSRAALAEHREWCGF
jgi:putative restriction endonuclease